MTDNLELLANCPVPAGNLGIGCSFQAASPAGVSEPGPCFVIALPHTSRPDHLPQRDAGHIGGGGDGAGKKSPKRVNFPWLETDCFQRGGQELRLSQGFWMFPKGVCPREVEPQTSVFQSLPFSS